MRLLLYSNVLHKNINGKVYAYGPYVKEINLWLEEFTDVTIIAPFSNQSNLDRIEDEIICSNINQIQIIPFSVVSIIDKFKAFFVVPINGIIIFLTMFIPGHVHVRCPSNVGLIASYIQILFPWKRKSFKYAGNWVDNIGQPISYKLQKFIISNCFLTRRSKSLVYGKGYDDKECVLDSFTATYSNSSAIAIKLRVLDPNRIVKLVFAGALIPGKNPFVAVNVCKILIEKGIDVQLAICGNGPLYNELYAFIRDLGLSQKIELKGNLDRSSLDKILQESHFLLMPSKSEGWPKSVTEAMWWGTLPIVSPISCLSFILDDGKRGVIVAPEPDEIASSII